MNSFDPSRVKVTFRDGVKVANPVVGRKYTMTHSDETAELFVVVGRQYAKDMFGPIRDEVILTIEKKDNELQFYGIVIIDDGVKITNSKLRYDIFLREMPLALRAIRYADRALFDRYPMLDQIPIYIWFQSEKAQYNKLYDFGTMSEYR